MNKAEEIADRLTKWANRLGFSTVSGDLSEIIKDIAAPHPKESAGDDKSEIIIDQLKSDLKRVKLQRNEYELEVRSLYRRITQLSSELKQSQSASAAPTADGMEDNDLIKGVVKRLGELKPYHMNPYNLGDEGEMGNLIDTLCKMFKLPPTPPTTKKD